MPTYLAIPLVTAACFFAAAFDAWLAVAHSTLPGALMAGALWLGLLVMALRGGNIEGAALAAGIVTLLTAGMASDEMGSLLDLPPAQMRLILVNGVLAGLAIANVLVKRRGSGKEPGRAA
jgi:hypothetical protein